MNLYCDAPNVRVAREGGYLWILGQSFDPENRKAHYEGGLFVITIENRGKT